MRQERRPLQKNWLAAALGCCILAAAFLAPAALAKQAGQLDLSFGRDGKVLTPFAPAPEPTPRFSIKATDAGYEAVMTEGGTTVVANDSTLIEYLPNGRVNRRFGQNGRATIPHAAGSVFELGGIASDSLGRLLVAGTNWREAQTPGYPEYDQPSGSASVTRFTAEGQIDRTFGSGGVLITDFGVAPAPKEGEGGSIKGTSPSPSVRVTGIRVDSQNRPLLGGGAVSRIAYCSYPHIWVPAADAFVARLTAAGSVDSNFGSDGIKRISSFSAFNFPASPPSSRVRATGLSEIPCERGFDFNLAAVADLETDGHPRLDFGTSGIRTLTLTHSPQSMLDSSGRLVLTGWSELLPEKGSQKVIRLLPNGDFDSHFGKVGKVTPKLSDRLETSDLALDSRGRILLTGSVHSANPESRKKPWFFVLRLTSAGRRDHDFGRNGLAIADFGLGTSVSAPQVFVTAGNRILIGGPISSPQLRTGGGYALARFLGGR